MYDVNFHTRNEHMNSPWWW